MLIIVLHLLNQHILTCSEQLPWDCGELLFQSLNVSELDSLSTSPGFNHLTLKLIKKITNKQTNKQV